MDKRKQTACCCAGLVMAVMLAACAAQPGQEENGGADDVTRLAEAARRGDLAELDRLLEAGDSVREPGVLQAAVLHRQYEAVRQLVARGAPVDGSAPRQPPLWFAVSHGDIQMTELLIDLGADVDRQTSQSGTPLHASAHSSGAREHRIALAELLLEHGADIDAIQEDPTLRARCLATALHAAVAALDRQMTEFLLVHGADPVLTGPGGRTPAECARERLRQPGEEGLRPDIEYIITLLEGSGSGA